MDLVVGATGHLGTRICELLRQRGREVRALVRSTSGIDKVSALGALGVDRAVGDLKDPVSIAAACRGVEVIYSTATAIVSRAAGDSLAAVDHAGQLALLRAAQVAGARHFVFISFPPAGHDFPIQTGKRAVEDALRKSGMTHTVLQASLFMEVWLSPLLGFDYPNARATVYGTGEQKISWISLGDVAEFAVRAATVAQARNAIVPVGGPQALSPNAVIAMFERAVGKAFEVTRIPEKALLAQFVAATDPLQRSFAGLQLFAAAGSVIPMEQTARAFGVKLTPLAEYVARVTA
jgi:uncharacterized protein YbjT (DUF2867 family)